MSKAVKRKISVELQHKTSSKSRLSVFQRLGTKKSKSISDSKSLTDDLKQTLSAAVSIKPTLSISKPDVELDDADPDILEKKRQEIQKELELQMKMDSRRAGAIRKRKRAPSSSESSSSSSDSESSSSSSSSSSTDDRHRGRKNKNRHRESSSSSDEYAKKLAKKKRSCQTKKEAMKLHKISKKHEIGSVARKSKRHSTSPPLSKKHRSDSSSALLMNPSSQKAIKNMKVSASIDKHHRIREKDIERAELLQREQKERERERLRLREERIHESPKMRRTSRTPKREFSRRTPPLRRSQSPKSRRSMSRRMDSCERERRDKGLVREAERRDALISSSERPNERERIAKDAKGQRLLPRPAERAMALAAAQERNADKEHVPQYSSRPYTDRSDTFDQRRHIKDTREHDRPYENRREPTDYQHGGSYRRDWNETANKERDWHEESKTKEIYDRHRDWDRKRGESNRPPVEGYSDRKDWSENSSKWESRKNSTWQPDSESGWNNRYKDDNWQDSNAPATSSHHARVIGEKSIEHATSIAIPKPTVVGVGGGGIMRRWNTWRGRGRGSAHHTDFRRPHHQTEILEERGEIYRRHINPQATNSPKPVSHKPIEPQSQLAVEKSIDEPSKSSNQDEFAEEIADDLSEISDEADDILGQQEDAQMKQQPIEKMDDTPIIEESETNHSAPALQKELNEPKIEKESKGEEKLQTPELTSALVKTPEGIDRSKDLGDDIDLDFEEISDGELEEEARIKGLGDALGVDWASLVEESKAMLREKLSKTETTVKQRWNPNQILLDTGISYKMAGQSFAEQTLIRAFESIKKEAQNLASIKTENTNDIHMDIDIKKEPNDDDDDDDDKGKVNGKHGGIDQYEGSAERKEGENSLILHPLPCVQTSIHSIAEKRHQLVFNASGPYSRGLFTKRDIAMRRQLCNLAINETNCKTVHTKNGSGYENIAMKLFQKALQA